MIDTTYVRATVCPVCGRQVKIYSKTWLAERQKEVKTLARLACKNCNKKEEVKHETTHNSNDTLTV
jgi:hypothetical protein